MVVARAGAQAQAKAWETVEGKARVAAMAASWAESGMMDWVNKVSAAWTKARAESIAWGDDADVLRAADEVANRANEVAKKADATAALAKKATACCRG